jgi:hypothetical protein
MGYFIMVLVLASFAVVAAAQFHAFVYVIVLVASGILVRVDCLLEAMSDRVTFLILVLLPTIGLGLSWLPAMLFRGAEWAT